jgi:DNA-binding protein HU-beta
VDKKLGMAADVAEPTTFLSVPNHISSRRAHIALLTRATIMAPKAKPTRPITLKLLAAQLAEDHQMTKRAGEALLGDMVTLITKHLKKGERIRIAGLGILQVRKRAARMGRNPATGEAIKIKASKKVAFRAAKDLKLAI